MDSNVEIVAPVVGDIGSCVAALLSAMGQWSAPPADWIKTVTSKRDENVTKMAPRLMNNNSPMDYHGALGVLRTIVKERPDAILVNEGANTLDLARGIIDVYQPRKRIDVGTWGVMGIGMGYAVGAAVETGKRVLAVEGDSAFGFSGMEVETICRYNLPVCIVVMNNNMLRLPGTPTGAIDDAFERLLLESCIPHIEASYRVLPGKWNRAIAGLSLGAYMSCDIAFRQIGRAHV